MSTCESPVQDKHIELYHAIVQVGTIVEQLRNLLNRIRGEEGEKVKAEQPVTVPTFEEVLNTSAGNLREVADQAHDRIDTLTHLLF